MPLQALRKAFLWTVIILGGFYILTIGYLMMNEENMIFFPSKEIIETPADRGWLYEEIEFTASDNMPIHGWKISGIDSADTLPVILFLHGNGGNISYNMPALEVLRMAGRTIYAFDYRGYGKSGGMINPRAFEEDCRSMLAYLLAHENIPGPEIIVHGHSLGAHGGAMLAADADLKGLVMEGAFTSIPDVAAEIYKILPIKSIMSVKMDNVATLISVDEPLLIIHARNDNIIPFHFGEALFAEANVPKDLLILEKGDHSDALFLNRDTVAVKYRDFFRY